MLCIAQSPCYPLPRSLIEPWPRFVAMQCTSPLMEHADGWQMVDVLQCLGKSAFDKTECHVIGICFGPQYKVYVNLFVANS